MCSTAASESAVNSAAALHGLAELLGACCTISGTTDGVRVSDAERIDRIIQLERLKSAAAALQAQETAAFAAAQAVPGDATEYRRDQARRSINAQIALARRDHPTSGGKHVGAAKALTAEMPHTFQALVDGDISEWRATIMVRETALLSLEHRQQVDLELAGKLASMGNAQITAAAARIAYRLDPHQAIKRTSRAEGDRYVSMRPAPDTMTILTALLPVGQGVGVWAALLKHAATAKASGDTRGRGQIMADELVSRLSGADLGAATEVTEAPNTDTAPDAAATPGEVVGSAVLAAPAAVDPSDVLIAPDEPQESTVSAEFTASFEAIVADCDFEFQPEKLSSDGTPEVSAEPMLDLAVDPTEDLLGLPAGVGVDIQLVMTDRTLFDGDDEPAIVLGYGPIPAPLARRLVRSSAQVKSWIRRLYTDRQTGQLVDMDPRRRLFPAAVRDFLVARDQTCRNSWCGAPIRHIDHIVPVVNGGPTTVRNGQGLCEACNLTKVGTGWAHQSNADGSITLTTPTGHQYRNQPPSPPRSALWAKAESESEFESEAAAEPAAEPAAAAEPGFATEPEAAVEPESAAESAGLAPPAEVLPALGHAELRDIAPWADNSLFSFMERRVGAVLARAAS